MKCKGVMNMEELVEEEMICPLCGKPLVDAPSGIWCVNPKCEVEDDYLMYDEEGRRNE
jgi:hypothetical protein